MYLNPNCFWCTVFFKVYPRCAGSCFFKTNVPNWLISKFHNTHNLISWFFNIPHVHITIVIVTWPKVVLSLVYELYGEATVPWINNVTYQCELCKHYVLKKSKLILCTTFDLRPVETWMLFYCSSRLNSRAISVQYILILKKYVNNYKYLFI